jgi:hypothetical protein
MKKAHLEDKKALVVRAPRDLRYAPVRVECPRCDAAPVETVAWGRPRPTQERFTP